MINSDLAICENNEKATNRYKIKTNKISLSSEELNFLPLCNIL